MSCLQLGPLSVSPEPFAPLSPFPPPPPPGPRTAAAAAACAGAAGLGLEVAEGIDIAALRRAWGPSGACDIPECVGR